MIHDSQYVISCGFFFFNDTATTEIYTLSLHDALPISPRWPGDMLSRSDCICAIPRPRDRKSTRLNSSHVSISYAVFCLKKKKLHEFCMRPLKLKKREPTYGLILFLI